MPCQIIEVQPTSGSHDKALEQGAIVTCVANHQTIEKGSRIPETIHKLAWLALTNNQPYHMAHGLLETEHSPEYVASIRGDDGIVQKVMGIGLRRKTVLAVQAGGDPDELVARVRERYNTVPNVPIDFYVASPNGVMITEEVFEARRGARTHLGTYTLEPWNLEVLNKPA